MKWKVGDHVYCVCKTNPPDVECVIVEFQGAYGFFKIKRADGGGHLYCEGHVADCFIGPPLPLDSLAQDYIRKESQC